MRALITGSAGMMGWGFKKVLGEGAVWTTRQDLDVTNLEQLRKYKNPEVDVIFHLAAETDHHYAEANPTHAYMLNTIAPAHLIDIAEKNKIPFVYIGTCGMFDGSKEIYYAYDFPSPLNIYGRSKWYGEMIARRYRRSYVCRCGWAMGGGEGVDIKFVGLIWKQIRAGAKELFCINDVFGSPTYTPYFAREVIKIMKGIRRYGVVHIAGGRASRYEVACEFVRLLGLDIKVNGISYKEFHERWPAKTPYTKREVLFVEPSILNNMDWKAGLAEYVDECYKGKIK